MRFLLLILTIHSFVAFGQKKDNSSCKTQLDTLTNLQIFTVVDKFPMVDGGMEALYTEISMRVKYPHGDPEIIGSKVIVAFVVNTKGQISGKRIIEDINGADLGK
jgi:hypothetical protein